MSSSQEVVLENAIFFISFFLFIFSSTLNKGEVHKGTNKTRLFWQEGDNYPGSELSCKYTDIFLPHSFTPRVLNNGKTRQEWKVTCT